MACRGLITSMYDALDPLLEFESIELRVDVCSIGYGVSTWFECWCFLLLCETGPMLDGEALKSIGIFERNDEPAV